MKELWIDGEWVPGAQGKGKVRRIENPATLEVVDEVVDGSPDDAKRACLKAAEAGRKWRHLPAIERGKLLHDAATKMREDRARLSELLTLEGGKPRIENLDEVEWSAACFQYYAEIARNSHGMSIPPTGEHQINFTIKEPLGVVAAIVPFNYPLLLLVWKIAPALAAGNTVVIKPSELTPLATLRLVEQSMSHLPPGVINVVTGTGQEVGEALVDDPNVACIASPAPRRLGHGSLSRLPRSSSGSTSSSGGSTRSSYSKTRISTSRCRAPPGLATSTPVRCAPRPSGSTWSRRLPSRSSSDS
jgi:acyl-CoA reductase-like NAD-dependent aldehyde dehydrogenase